MLVDVQKVNGIALITPSEKLDYINSPDFEKAVKDNINDIDKLIVDMVFVDYMSSAGVRVFLMAEKIMQGKEGIVLVNVNESVKKVFDISGFSDVIKFRY